MNVLKPHLQSTVFTLIQKGLSQREIHRKTGIDRKTIRGYANMMVAVAVAAESNSSTLATGSGELPDFQIPPPRPPAICAEISLRAMPKLARSACEPHREWIEAQVRLGRNAVAIYQELVDQRGCRFHRCRPYADPTPNFHQPTFRVRHHHVTQPPRPGSIAVQQRCRSTRNGTLSLMQKLRFLDGVLEDIETLGYDFNQ